MLVPLTTLTTEAHNSGYAIGSFNVASMAMIEAVLNASAETNTPVIVSTNPTETRTLRPEIVVPLVRTLSDELGVSCALHLDHGDSFALAMRCLRAGYTSIMFDGSHYPIEENIRLTKQIVDAAHAVGVSVEGEVGTLSGVEDALVVSAEDAYLTNIDEAVRFVKETSVDVLAVAIGNAHGFYKQEPKLDFDRLDAIHKSVGIPIVLHGGTGIPSADVRRAIGLGIAKMNVAARNRRAYLSTIHAQLDPNPNTTKVHDVLAAGKAAMQREVVDAIRMMRADLPYTM